MPPVTLKGFLSKKEIEAAYGRSHRSLTRDITRAVRTGDTKILRHLKLVTEDEQVREGTEVTLQMIQDLSNHGLRPTWHAEESWIADWCARHASHRGPDAQPTEAPQKTKARPSTTPQPFDPPASSTQPATVELLQQRIDDQKHQIDMLRGELQIKNEQIRTANQLAEQSQQLMRDLHVLLKNVQDGLLGEGSRRRLAIKAPPNQQPHPIVEPTKPAAHRKVKRAAKPAARKKTVKPKRSAKPAASRPASDHWQRWFPTLLGRKAERK